MYFIDSDVILDFTLRREPFFEKARRIFFSDEALCTSTLVLANVFYHCMKFQNKKMAITDLQELLIIFKEVPLSFEDINGSLNSRFKDKEDGFNYFACIRNPEVKGIVTRNSKDFINSQIPVYTPEAYLSHLED